MALVLRLVMGCLLLAASTSNATTFDFRFTVPLIPAKDECSHIYSICWSFDIDPVTVNLSTDSILIRIDFPDSFRLKWEDDGITMCCAFPVSEAVEAFAYDATNTDPSGNIFNAWRGGSLTFLDVDGDLLVNNMAWNVGLSGAIGNHSFWDPAYRDFTNSGFSFSGLEFGIGPLSCGGYSVSLCSIPGTAVINHIDLNLSSGVFNVVNSRRVPEPGTLALLGLGLAGLGLSQRRKAA